MKTTKEAALYTLKDAAIHLAPTSIGALIGCLITLYLTGKL